MYEECRKYGPYINRENRRIILLIFPDRKRKTISYARYLMECHLNRYLLETEDVHHIDENKLNDVIENFEIIEHQDHCQEHSIKYNHDKNIKVTCIICNKEFYLSEYEIHRRLYERERRNLNIEGFLCSRSCQGYYGKGIQLKELKQWIAKY
jgi:hypothetical protein